LFPVLGGPLCKQKYEAHPKPETCRVGDANSSESK
jgi:hypothetical protein